MGWLCNRTNYYANMFLRKYVLPGTTIILYPKFCAGFMVPESHHPQVSP